MLEFPWTSNDLHRSYTRLPSQILCLEGSSMSLDVKDIRIPHLQILHHFVLQKIRCALQEMGSCKYDYP